MHHNKGNILFYSILFYSILFYVESAHRRAGRQEQVSSPLISFDLNRHQIDFLIAVVMLRVLSFRNITENVSRMSYQPLPLRVNLEKPTVLIVTRNRPIFLVCISFAVSDFGLFRAGGIS